MSWVFNTISKGLGYLIVVAMWALVSGSASAQNESEAEKVPTAHEVVRQVTGRMLEVIRNNRQTLEENPQRFYDQVETVLESVVDFKFIARGVMGPYAEKASEEQRRRFTEKFKQGLVSTYAKGMAGYGDREIDVLPPNSDIGNRRRVSVVQEVRGNDGGVNRVSYTMQRSGRKGEWKLVNVILNGVNLGVTFRSQFAQAVQKNGGNLNSVIDNWGTTG